MSSRLGVACPVTLLQQEDFTEPMVRINTDRIDGAEFGWSETSAWDAEAEFYQQAAK
jgi:UDP-glucose 4-epimerase